jgi:4'-phosphopantetheinyl transferase
VTTPPADPVTVTPPPDPPEPPRRPGTPEDPAAPAPARPRAFGPGPGPTGTLPPPTPGTADLWLLRAAHYLPWLAPGLPLLDDGERRRCAAFVRAADRDRYAAAHIALRRLLGAYLGIAPEAVRLGRERCPVCGGPHGRPAVAGEGAGRLHFSLSHGGDLVLLAFATAPVGADVESAPEPAVVADVARVLHPDESAELAALTDPAARAAAFGRCWTRKEAHLKGTGAGLAEGVAATYVGTGVRPAAVPGWRLTDVAVDPGHHAAVALATEAPATEPPATDAPPRTDAPAA